MMRNALDGSNKIFSLRRLSLGLCSVVIGTLFLTVQNKPVRAAAVNQQQEIVESQQGDTQLNAPVEAKTTDQQNIVENTKKENHQNTTAKVATTGQKEKIQVSAPVEAKTTNQQKIVKNEKGEDHQNTSAKVAITNQQQEIVENQKEKAQLSAPIEARTTDQQKIVKNEKDEDIQNTINNKTKAILDNNVESTINTKQTVKSQSTDQVKNTDLTLKIKKNVDLLKLANQKNTYVNQWVTENGKSYYYDNQGKKIYNQWAAPTGTLHYFGKEGYIIENQWYTMPTNDTYYFDNTGHTVKNRWYGIPDQGIYYFDNTGHTVKNRWYGIPDQGTYYFDNTGHTVKNRWYGIPGQGTYYFDNTGHTVKNRWYGIPGQGTYYFDNTGHTVKNRWYTLPTNDTYYFDNTGHTVKNRWYTLPTNDTYYFDNTGHTVRNRYYVLNGTNYYFDNEGHTHAVQSSQNDLHIKIDPDTTELSGKISGTGEIWVKDPSGKEVWKPFIDTAYSLGKGVFEFDASQYSGETITVEVKSDKTSKAKLISSETVSVPKMTISNIKIDPNTTKLSGRINGEATIWIKDPNGKEKVQMTNYNDDNDGFSFDASQYGGETITIELKVDESENSRIITSKTISVPKLKISNLTMEPNTTILTGNVNGNGTIWIKDSNGKGEGYFNIDNNSFAVDVGEYSGKTISVEVTPEDISDSRVITSTTIHVPIVDNKHSGRPSQHNLNLSIDTNNMKMTGQANGVGDISIKYPNEDGWEDGGVTQTDKEGNFSLDVSRYSGEYITVEVTPGYYSSTSSDKIIASETIYVPKLVFSNLSVDSNTKLSGRINGSSDIWVKEPDGKETEQVYIENTGDNNFSFDASQYSGENITVEARSGGESTDDRIVSTEQFYVPKLVISDISIDTDGGTLSGKINGNCTVVFKDPNGEEEGDIEIDNNKFSFDIRQYGGKYITVEVKPYDSPRVISSKRIYIPVMKQL